MKKKENILKRLNVVDLEHVQSNPSQQYALISDVERESKKWEKELKKTHAKNLKSANRWGVFKGVGGTVLGAGSVLGLLETGAYLGTNFTRRLSPKKKFDKLIDEYIEDPSGELAKQIRDINEKEDVPVSEKRKSKLFNLLKNKTVTNIYHINLLKKLFPDEIPIIDQLVSRLNANVQQSDATSTQAQQRRSFSEPTWHPHDNSRFFEMVHGGESASSSADSTAAALLVTPTELAEAHGNIRKRRRVNLRLTSPRKSKRSSPRKSSSSPSKKYKRHSSPQKRKNSKRR